MEIHKWTKALQCLRSLHLFLGCLNTTSESCGHHGSSFGSGVCVQGLDVDFLRSCLSKDHEMLEAVFSVGSTRALCGIHKSEWLRAEPFRLRLQATAHRQSHRQNNILIISLLPVLCDCSSITSQSYMCSPYSNYWLHLSKLPSILNRKYMWTLWIGGHGN